MFSVSVFYDERIVVVAEQRPDASEEDSFQWMSRVLQVSPPGDPGRLALSPGWQQPLCKRFLRGPVMLPYFSLTNHDSGILGAISKIR